LRGLTPPARRRSRLAGAGVMIVRSRLVPGLILLLSTAAFAVTVFTLLRGRASAGHGMPDYSVYSSAPDGLAQAADVLRKLGRRPWRAAAQFPYGGWADNRRRCWCATAGAACWWCPTRRCSPTVACCAKTT